MRTMQVAGEEKIRTLSLLIQSNPPYRRLRFRTGLSRLISGLRSGSASEHWARIWREFGAKPRAAV